MLGAFLRLQRHMVYLWSTCGHWRVNSRLSSGTVFQGWSALEGLVHNRISYAAFQKLGELFSNYGAAKKVSLALAASFFLQKVELFLGLHALGDYAMLQALSDVDQGAENHGIVGTGGNVVDEATVDFQSIQGEFSQIAKARIPHPKIVHR